MDFDSSHWLSSNTTTDGLGIATKATCYKETFSDQIKKKQLWKSSSVIAFSSFLMVAISLKEIHAHLFFAVLIHTKFWFPKLAQGG